MEKREATEDKIILPEKLQREMIKFFLKAFAPPKATNDKETPTTPITSTE